MIFWMYFDTNLDFHSGLGLLLQLFDACILNTTRDESPPHFVLVNIAVCHDDYETYQTTTRRRLAHGRLLFHLFCYFHTFLTLVCPFEYIWNTYTTLFSAGGPVPHLVLAQTRTRTRLVASSKGTYTHSGCSRAAHGVQI